MGKNWEEKRDRKAKLGDMFILYLFSIKRKTHSSANQVFTHVLSF